VTRQDGLAGEVLRSVFQDEGGRMWLGSEYDGLAVQSGAGWHIVTPRSGLAGWEVKTMLQDPDGTYWLGTENGLSRIASWDGPSSAEPSS
jgi:ligand-binding sensor domain-containing protein